MRSFITTFLFFVVIISMIAFATTSSVKTSPDIFFPKKNTAGFAVMELFTSQGCSSCPPADNLLGKYAATENSNVIALAFHVDYWNRLGWTDSFSTAKYSNRQRDYSMSIDQSSVYTPQLIINGTKEFVGSDESKIAAAVGLALNEKPALSITIDKIQTDEDKVSINYTIDKIMEHTSLQAALVQRKIVTNILKGENKGLNLVNYNVVRDFITMRIYTKNSQLQLQLPKGYNKNNFAVVLFVQENASGKITGATKMNL